MKKIAVITGASRGIGYATAQRLKSKYQIINLSRTASPDPEIISIKVDISKYGEVQKAFIDIIDKYGVPYILINNAGTIVLDAVVQSNPDVWSYIIDTNLKGCYYCTREFVTYAKEFGGKIINIASTAGTRPSPEWSAYAASKAGIINFSQTIAEEFKIYGIEVTCISPGRVATELRKTIAPTEDPALITQPEEVAEFVEYILKSNLLKYQNIILKK